MQTRRKSNTAYLVWHLVTMTDMVSITDGHSVLQCVHSWPLDEWDASGLCDPTRAPEKDRRVEAHHS